MNWVTILVLLVWGLTAFWGYRTGLIRMVVPLVVIVVGLALSSRIARPMSNLFSFISENENVQTVIAFIVIFVVLIIAGIWLSGVARAAISIIPLAGTANGLAGAAVGILIGFIILSGLLSGLQRFPVGNLREDISHSRVGTFLADNFDVVTRGARLIPRDWNHRARDISDGIQGTMDDVWEHIRKVGGLQWTMDDIWDNLRKVTPGSISSEYR